MATIPEPSLFRWDCVDQLGDLERLLLVLDAIPDEPLMQLLERQRRNGRNDYPVRPMWNSLIAGFVFGHDSIASLRRELLRNAQLREVCGFDLFQGTAAVPTEFAYTRFQRRLAKQEAEVQQIYHHLLDLLKEQLPDLGAVLALDGKELHASAKKESKYELAEDEKPDGRRDHNADWGAKGNGKKKRWWFGYLVHLIVDATYELPVAFEVTPASYGEQPVAQLLLDQLQERHPDLLETCERLSADKGYDDSKLIERLWDQHQIKPIIDIRNCWKDSDAEEDGVRTKLVNGQEYVIYSYDGQVFCRCPETDVQRAMDYGGFERDRNTLKYRCPARYSGITCEGMEQCPVADAVRIKLQEDRRIFTPVARSSYDWQDYYDERSAVERVNSRLAGGYGFDHPFIRGLTKMRLRMTMGLTIMLAMALGRIQAGQPENLRSLVRPA